MTDNNKNTAFEEKLKDTLKNYEVPNASPDWARMENMLNVAPKSHSFNWKIASKAAVGIVVVVGGYVIYNAIPESTKTENKVEETKSEKNSVTVEPKIEPTKTEQQIIVPINNNSLEANQNKEEVVVKLEETKTVVAAEKAKENKKEAEKTKNQKIFKMGNEPIFGDMLDSSKGIVGKTQEKEEVKKAAKEQTHTKTNWNDFLFSPVMPDTIKKNREKAKADSLKTD